MCRGQVDLDEYEHSLGGSRLARFAFGSIGCGTRVPRRRRVGEDSAERGAGASRGGAGGGGGGKRNLDDQAVLFKLVLSFSMALPPCRERPRDTTLGKPGTR